MGILDSISEFFRDMVQGWVQSNLSSMFSEANYEIAQISGEVSQTPSVWNSDIFTMIKKLSDTVIVPIGGLIISFVLVYELISMVMDKNNMHDFDTSLFFRFVIKAGCGVMILTKTFDIVMAVFDLSGNMINQAGTIVTDDTAIDVAPTLLLIFKNQLTTMSYGDLISLGFETMIVSLATKIMSLVVTVVLYGRMLEIYLYISVAPVPFATVMNKEWGSIGTNYFKGICALAIQGFFIMVCVAIYAVLVRNIAVATDLSAAIWRVGGYTLILCFGLLKTGNLAKAVLGAH